MTPEAIAALLRPVPGYTGSCARSPAGVDDDVPIGNGAFESVVAIGKIIGADGRIAGWVYKTVGNHLRIQRAFPPLDQRSGSKGSVGHDYSGIDPLVGDIAATVRPCTKRDYRYRTHPEK